METIKLAVEIGSIQHASYHYESSPLLEENSHKIQQEWCPKLGKTREMKVCQLSSKALGQGAIPKLEYAIIDTRLFFEQSTVTSFTVLLLAKGFTIYLIADNLKNEWV